MRRRGCLRPATAALRPAPSQPERFLYALGTSVVKTPASAAVCGPGTPTVERLYALAGPPTSGPRRHRFRSVLLQIARILCRQRGGLERGSDRAFIATPSRADAGLRPGAPR